MQLEVSHGYRSGCWSLYRRFPWIVDALGQCPLNAPATYTLSRKRTADEVAEPQPLLRQRLDSSALLIDQLLAANSWVLNIKRCYSSPLNAILAVSLAKPDPKRGSPRKGTKLDYI